YTLSTQNTPVLTKLGAWARGFNSPFKAEVYFVTTREFRDQKWGTTNPVPMRDPEFGQVRLRAFGIFAFRVEDAAAFLRNVVGTDGLFTTEELTGQPKRAVVSSFSSLVAEARIPLLDLAAHYDDLSTALAERVKPEFQRLGLGLSRLYIENISVPPEVEARMDRSTGAQMVQDVDRYQRVAAADALSGAGQRGGAGSVAADMAAAMAVGSAMVGAFAPSGGHAPAAPAPAGLACPSCRQPAPAGAKFCPSCGGPLPAAAAAPAPGARKFCTSCGAALAPGAAFCGGCGTKTA
ncbi:MAG: SPFH domain-containing protein, partial [Planctomycetales bacterium]|nr:SPFH domain-containing protein [Planctomycetales bacterium]